MPTSRDDEEEEELLLLLLLLAVVRKRRRRHTRVRRRIARPPVEYPRNDLLLEDWADRPAAFEHTFRQVSLSFLLFT
jgi:hypothetical protein